MKILAMWIGGGMIVLAGVGLLVLQLVPVDSTNPPVVAEPAWDTPATRALMDRACFDCHSNETRWPWYARVAPVSWQIADHVHAGRSHFNLSMVGTRYAGELEAEEMIEVIMAGEMPPANYLWLHPEARLTAAEQAQLIAGIRATFSQQPARGDDNRADDRGRAEHDDDDDDDDNHDDDDD